MARKKIFNDPVYGFVSVPYGIIFELIEHPYFQRLRRIKQVSMTHFVYPGALHTRFHHALGAFHLMNRAITVLRSKEVPITEAEAEAASIAILLHDIGHGPFSHTLEHSLIEVSHEFLSDLFMQKLNREFDGKLDLAIAIFEDRYSKKFLHQLVSSQLDMDRMDYLNRDSFFTGVYEGVIGYDRIIEMLAVHQGELVVEVKGIYSIEKFLMARRLMYWQVYLHKTVLSAEQMLKQALRRARYLVQQGEQVDTPPALEFFLNHTLRRQDFEGPRQDELLDRFAALDDFDLVSGLKMWMSHPDAVLRTLACGLIERRLFRLELHNQPVSKSYADSIRRQIANWWKGPEEELEFLFISGRETNRMYNTAEEEIKILHKNGETLPMSLSSDHYVEGAMITKFFLCYPKIKGKKYI